MQKAATELETRRQRGRSDAAGGVTRVQVEEPPFRVTQYLVWGSLSLFAGAMQAVLILFFVVLPARVGRSLRASW